MLFFINHTRVCNLARRYDSLRFGPTLPCTTNIFFSWSHSFLSYSCVVTLPAATIHWDLVRDYPVLKRFFQHHGTFLFYHTRVCNLARPPLRFTEIWPDQHCPVLQRFFQHAHIFFIILVCVTLPAATIHWDLARDCPVLKRFFPFE